MERALKVGKCIFLNTLKAKTVLNRHSLTLARYYSTPWSLPYNRLQKNHFTSPHDTSFKKFHSLGPNKPQNVDSKLSHLPKVSNFNLVNGFPKTFFWRKSNRDPKPRKKRVPRLILIQNPFTWLMTKIDFRVLRSVWDKDFREKDFKFGAIQAISRVTNVISDGQYQNLNGLLTKPARASLLRELERNWNDRQRSLLALRPEDIQISAPRKVYFIRIADKKYCDVDTVFLALKWTPVNDSEVLIFTEIFARFHREYTPHCIPEWTIAYFKVTRFQALRRQ